MHRFVCKNTWQTAKQWSPPASGTGVGWKTKEFYLSLYTNLNFFVNKYLFFYNQITFKNQMKLNSSLPKRVELITVIININIFKVNLRYK